LFFSNPDQRFYLRDTIRRLEAGAGSVQKEIARLTEAGILTRVRDGNQVYHQANPDCPIFVELKALCLKTFGVTEALRQALRPISKKIRCAFVYGSLAAGRETSESDVDLIVVGDDLRSSDVIPLLGPASRQIFREVNPTVYETGEFSRKLGEKKHFLSSVMDGPKLLIIGNEDELRGLAKARLAKGTQDQPGGDRKSLRDR
jgi:hypothetical protein